MSVQTRLLAAENAVRCRRCGLSLLHIRQNLAATVEIVRREIPAERSEAIVDELRRIWTA